ncbi:MAG: type II toxin-antitoxin system RatA family toxin [Armatimonadota bacterium]
MPVVESSVVIHAPVERVMELAKDIEKFPEFMKDVKSVQIISREGHAIRARWVGRIEELRIDVKWIEEDVWDDEAKMSRFRQIEGDYSKFEGEWHFESVPEGTLFRSTLEIEYDVPLIGPLLKGLIAKKAKENLDATLEAIKRQAEATEAT